MISLILQTTVRFLIPLMLMFSLFLLFRGHNSPGGGFVGGLVAAVAFVLHSIAYGTQAVRLALPVDPRHFIGWGLLTALCSGLSGIIAHQPFLTGQWSTLHVPGFGEFHVGTPVLFDIGVYLTVMGVTMTIIFSLQDTD